MVNRMDIGRLQQQSETRWIIPRTGRMRTPAILYASPELIHAMDTKVLEQLANIAALLGIRPPNSGRVTTWSSAWNCATS